ASEAANFMQALTPTDNAIGAQSQLRTSEAMGSMMLSRVNQVRQTGPQGANLGAIKMAALSGGKGVMTDGDQTLPTLSEASPMKPGWSAYGEVRGLRSRIGAQQGYLGSRTNMVTGLIGLDFSQKNYIVGAALHVANGDGKQSNRAATSKSDTYAVSAYGSIFSPKLALDVYATRGTGNLDLTRTAGLLSAVGSTDTTLFNIGAALSSPTKVKWGSFTPSVSLAYDQVDIDAYRETGAIALSVNKRKVKSFVGRLGVAAMSDQAKTFKPWARIALAHDFEASDSGTKKIGFVSATGPNFVDVAGLVLDKTWGELGLGIDTKLDKATLGLSYETTLGRDNVQIEQIRARIRFTF
ncbi:autotransporter outer membrane beta-barrel domain-containing protein, partial [Candidatus Phycosocius spiralis]|uniref:autotransporter outer membrane beta-barrel domain-containing protein n=1 Tax=Candidatus Phycosocius spiralis TaxID=2815099 RepID=UPI0024E13068